MNLTYIPRSQLREALLAGHRLVPGHEYRPGDWAILMQEPEGERLPLYVIDNVSHWLAGKPVNYYASNKERENRNRAPARREVEPA